MTPPASGIADRYATSPRGDAHVVIEMPPLHPAEMAAGVDIQAAPRFGFPLLDLIQILGRRVSQLGPSCVSTRPALRAFMVMSNVPLLCVMVYAAVAGAPLYFTISVGLTALASIVYHACQRPRREQQSVGMRSLYIFDVLAAFVAVLLAFVWLLLAAPGTKAGSWLFMFGCMVLLSLITFAVSTHLHAKGRDHDASVAHSFWHLTVAMSAFCLVVSLT